jgi:hypothetical protein
LIPAELSAYAALVQQVSVIFQPKAWADEVVCIAWLDQFQNETSSLGDRLLGMDGHGSQMTSIFRDLMRQYLIHPVYTPPNCTDVVAPVDHHVGRKLKGLIEDFYHAAMAINRDAWCNPPGIHGGLEAWERRVLMTCWVARAWAIIQSDYQHLLRSAFITTGFLLAMDGSENNLVKIPGVANYDLTKVY